MEKILLERGWRVLPVPNPSTSQRPRPPRLEEEGKVGDRGGGEVEVGEEGVRAREEEKVEADQRRKPLPPSHPSQMAQASPPWRSSTTHM